MDHPTLLRKININMAHSFTIYNLNRAMLMPIGFGTLKKCQGPIKALWSKLITKPTLPSTWRSSTGQSGIPVAKGELF